MATSISCSQRFYSGNGIDSSGANRALNGYEKTQDLAYTPSVPRNIRIFQNKNNGGGFGTSSTPGSRNMINQNRPRATFSPQAQTQTQMQTRHQSSNKTQSQPAQSRNKGRKLAAASCSTESEIESCEYIRSDYNQSSDSSSSDSSDYDSDSSG
ncbi:hypothetical protein AYI68_g4155 [Smittium mucronatum]|uniref:Uncharacterized protein n=1 Tax=Smittium mucronatum TaxID=133383 RepID=A0A1R0GXV4_9FUNG|nr:hypothetical protein AYI68_g4155 [Smittium mucronatum]